MFARIRGPSRKPVWAATKRIAPAATSVSTISRWPSPKPPIVQPPKTFSARIAFMTLDGCGRVPVSRYPKMIPEAVKASDTAM